MNPPPFPDTAEQEPVFSDMRDGDSDEGEDIFLGSVSTIFIYSIMPQQPFSACLKQKHYQSNKQLPFWHPKNVSATE